MKNKITILSRIDEYYFNLTSSQKKAAEYIKDNMKEVAFSTTNELSKKIGVSEAAIVRLARVFLMPVMWSCRRRFRGSSSRQI